jgi:multimeric flavodoxin WrbA
MRAVGVSGSYREGGVVDQAVAAVLEGAAAAGAETRSIRLRDLDLRYCTNCRQCGQSEGDEPGRCRHTDDMAGVIEDLRRADVVVVGSPMNIGQITALTKAFEERLAPLFYWPWGSKRPSVRRRSREQPAAAVIVTSSAMPAIAARLLGPAALSALRDIAGLLGATVVDELSYGVVASTPTSGLRQHERERAREAGARAVELLPRLGWPLGPALPYAARATAAARELADLGRLAVGRDGEGGGSANGNGNGNGIGNGNGNGNRNGKARAG